MMYYNFVIHACYRHHYHSRIQHWFVEWILRHFLKFVQGALTL